MRGPDYIDNRKKVPSASAMFEPVGGDCVISDGPVRHFASRVKLPDTSATLPHYCTSTYNNPAGGSAVPSLLVINVQIPMQPRAMFGARNLPPTVNAVFYMQLTPLAAHALNKLYPPTGGGGEGGEGGGANAGGGGGGAAAAAETPVEESKGSGGGAAGEEAGGADGREVEGEAGNSRPRIDVDDYLRTHEGALRLMNRW